MATQSNVCACTVCVGPQCTCGCQTSESRQTSSCQCGENCQCGDGCTCGTGEDAAALVTENR